MKKRAGRETGSGWQTPIEYMTRAEVARLLGVSPNTVTRWAREGRLPSQVTLGGHHRFRRTVILEIRDGLCRGATVARTESQKEGDHN